MAPRYVAPLEPMAQLVYIDETGSVGRGAKAQPYLTVVAAAVDEEMVQPLSVALQQVAWDHLGWYPADMEFHGHEIWNGRGHWSGMHPDGLIAAYEAAIALLDVCEVALAHASIDKAKLNARYGGAADGHAYRLALQFLLEKVDRGFGSARKILVADEAKEEQFRAIKMVADMQQWGGGEVPGTTLTTIIDSLHFVSSHASPGVQVADLVAYILQRRLRTEHHPNAQAAMDRLSTKVNEHVRTWRQPWPA
jgi:hypothetical protein